MELAKMEKKISDDDHHQPSSSGGDSRPSLKIRIRITPEMMKQLKWDKEEEEAVKEMDVKSEKKEEVVVVPEVKAEQQLVDCFSSSSSLELKLEATKRKLHDSYQQIANAKRQRRIQVIDPCNLPTQAAGRKGTSAGGGGGGGAKSRILNVILSKKKTRKNTNNLLTASRSTVSKPSYIC